MTELPTKQRVLEALKRVKGPDLGSDIVSQGLVSEIVINKGKVYFAISVDPARASELEALRQTAERVVKALPGVDGVAVTLTADRAPAAPREAAATARAHSHRHKACARLGLAPRAMHATGPAECPASPTSSRSPPVKAASANRRRPSISRSR